MDSVGFRFIHSPKAPLDRNVTHCQTLLRHSCNDTRVCQEDATGDWHVAFCKMIRKMVPSGLQLTTSGTKMPKEMLLTASRRTFHCACFNLILLQDIFTIVRFFIMCYFRHVSHFDFECATRHRIWHRHRHETLARSSTWVAEKYLQKSRNRHAK